MEIAISEQAFAFLLSCLLGVGVGILYDCFRIMRVAFFHGRVITIIEDLLFWILTAVITFLFQLEFSRGQIRLYILTGEILGFIVYYFTVGAIIIRCSKLIINIVKKFLGLLYRIFLFPFVKLFVFIFQKVKWLFVHIKSKCKKVQQNSKIHLHKQGSLLYNQSKSTCDVTDDKDVKRKFRKIKKRKKQDGKG